jgi:hypothetical protein
MDLDRGLLIKEKLKIIMNHGRGSSGRIVNSTN